MIDPNNVSINGIYVLAYIYIYIYKFIYTHIYLYMQIFFYEEGCINRVPASKISKWAEIAKGKGGEVRHIVGEIENPRV